ncbi:MAG: hypothetical protein CMN34_06965 [Saprospirales bacterium]|nr:hypothetical protein [Saprospirales bacterium]|tara:strand:+ start:683 stop:1090 length:408 start_codon:yes stop_codon:yes gene_type:complete
MKKFITILFFANLSLFGFSQSIQNYKIKTTSNAEDRTMMLDILRANLYQEFEQEFVFVVNHFKVGNGYAWFMGDAQRRDRQEIILPNYDYDCCHVEALFKRINGKWYLVESGAFSTDLWWDGIWEDHEDAPRGIF